MIDIHEAALSSDQSIYHEFLARYKEKSKTVYGFVEGIDDPSFYRGFIENLLPRGWEVELWRAGNKDRVIQLYKTFNWDRFSMIRIVFFIDRDLSEFVGATLPQEINIYITDKYSIENDIVDRGTCLRVLEEICKVTNIKSDEMDHILNQFESELAHFREKMVPIMCWIIHWRRNGYKLHLDNICMKHLYLFSAGILKDKINPRGNADFLEYIHSQCGITVNPGVNIDTIEEEFRAADGVHKFIRGKYELWFMVHFALSVHCEISNFSSTITSSPSMNITLSDANAIVLIGPRARIPESLRKFIENTLKKYTDEFQEAA